MSITSELVLENEQLLRGIEVRQQSLNRLSTYLSELESQLALIFAASPDIIVFLDEEGKIIKISDAAYPILGYKREELLGKYLWDFIALTDLAQTQEHFKELQNSKIIYFDERKALVNHWISKSGKLIKLIWRFTLCDDREHQTIGVASDITHFGSSDKYNFKMLQRAVDLSRDGVVVTDAQNEDNIIIYVNESYEKMTGYTKDELINKNTRFLQTDDCKSSRAVKTLRHCLSQGKGCDVLLQNKRKNGEVFYNRLAVSAVVEQNRVVNYIGISRDVTDNVGIKYDWSPNTESGFCAVIE